jgi:putative heme transporter
VAFTTLQPGAVPASPGSTKSWARSGIGRLLHHRGVVLALIEVVAAALAAVLVGSKIPSLVSSIGHNLDRLRHPSPFGLGLALGAELVALMAAAVIPRLLLRRHGVALGRRDALAIGIAANGLAVVVPGGAVPSSVWLARQLNRRGASATLAAWSVLASGFAAAITLIMLLLIGAGVAGVISGLDTVALAVVVVVGGAVFLGAVHRVDRLAAWSESRDGHDLFSRLVARFVALAAEAARWRAGWRTGTEVLAASVVNWLADAGCLVAVFALVRAPVPWQSILVAYAAGQLLGAVVPLPGGLGAVEGGLVGTLVALGSPAGPVVVAVAIYRLVGYWLPAAAALPAYGWARRNVVAVLPAVAAALPAAVAALPAAAAALVSEVAAGGVGAATASMSAATSGPSAVAAGGGVDLPDTALTEIEAPPSSAPGDRVPPHWVLADLEMWGPPGGLCAVSGR